MCDSKTGDLVEYYSSEIKKFMTANPDCELEPNVYQSFFGDYYYARCAHCPNVLQVAADPFRSSGHVHEWKQYVGFTERYEYCDCGTKR